MTKHFDPAFGRKNAGARADDHLELKSVLNALEKRDAEIKAFAEKASEEIKANGEMAAETKAALEKLSTAGSELSERLVAVEQRLGRRSVDAPGKTSLGEQFTGSDDFKALQSKGRGTARLNVKATITSATTDAAGSAGDLIRPDRLPGVVSPIDRPLTIRDLLLPGRTSSNAIEFVQETGFTNSAAPVAEGGDKPQSDLEFDLTTTNVRTIAHWFAASKQVLADVPMLMSYINTRALYGLKYVEEAQLLNGNGTGQNLNGLLNQATAFAEGTYSVAEDTAIDTIRRAILQARMAEYRPTFVVLSPIDWAAIETTKDGDKRYLIVPMPTTGAEMRLWRLAVIETTAMSAGEFLVGSTMGAQVFDREDAAVEVSTEHDDYFTKNLVAIRAEERLALAVYRPESYVYGQFELGESPTINA